MEDQISQIEQYGLHIFPGTVKREKVWCVQQLVLDDKHENVVERHLAYAPTLSQAIKDCIAKIEGA